MRELDVGICEEYDRFVYVCDFVIELLFDFTIHILQAKSTILSNVFSV